ncbi:DUF3299 domain-containing protein [Ruegeria sp. SCP11]|uniref:DUF3299 domain-containing protein n=1 Tax=Ruegeria sp. SCP11 TaxID=3141378 RepID=UPI0033362805
MGRTTIKLRIVSAVSVALLGSGSLAEPLHVSWADLRKERPQECSELLANYLSNANCTGTNVSDRMLSMQLAECTPGNAKLDGNVIRIAGYAHPVEFEFRNVKRFLLVPPMRKECRHPLPPLPDQVIAVEYPEGLDIDADPVWITGRLQIRPSGNDIAPSAYRINATKVATATIPDVSAPE